jgi:D-lyxose ketol-isomerase
MKRSEYTAAQEEVRKILGAANIALSPRDEIEVVDFGFGDYRRRGLGIVVRVNEPEYCSKWLTLLPGQVCIDHYHNFKKETFFCIKGIVEINLPGKKVTLKPGEKYTLTPGTLHNFTSKDGAVVEEVSMHDENADSIFPDASVVRDVRVQEDK